MIIGMGSDIIEVERIKKAIDRWGDNFLNHIFTKEELAYAHKRKYPTQHLAARFAAKEAIFKAVGNNPNLSWKDMSILNDQYGRPYCLFKDKKYKNKIIISISHTENYAIANAIITS